MITLITFAFGAFLTASSSAITNFPKCCDESDQIDTVNGSVLCTVKNSTRHEVYASSYRTGPGKCIDVNNNKFSIYNIAEGNTISTFTTLQTKPFRKCCPLGHFYKTDTRSCVNSTSASQDFIPAQHIQVGLPDCRVILDTNLGVNINASVFWSRQDREPHSCLDKNEDGAFIVRKCEKSLKVCKRKRCFKKCCPDGQSFVGGGSCKDTFTRGIEIQGQLYSSYIESPEDEYEVIYDAGCSDVAIYPTNTLQYSITKSGVFRYYSNYTDKFIEEEPSDLSGYCIEHATKGSTEGYFMFRCYQVKEINEKFTLTLWAKIVSSILLVATVVIYFYLGEVKSSFGKILVSYCLVMLMLMITLITSITSADEVECKIRGFLLILFSCVTYSWVNVMSYDIWSTFGTPMKPICISQKNKDVRRFLLYCLYAWGVGFCHMIILVILEDAPFLPDSIRPRIGKLYCFVENVNYGRLLFYSLPYFILQAINVVLFVKTAIYCVRVKNEIQKISNSGDSRRSGKFMLAKEKFALIFKLAIIMGVIWLIELLSNFISFAKTYSEIARILEIVLDTLTCCQGIFIFIIFICKKKTLDMMKIKLGWGSRRNSASTTPSSEVNGHIALNRGQTPIRQTNLEN